MEESQKDSAEAHQETCSDESQSPYQKCSFHLPYAALKKINSIDTSKQSTSIDTSVAPESSPFLIKGHHEANSVITEEKQIEETASAVAKIIHQSSDNKSNKNTLSEIIGLFEHLNKPSNPNVNSTITLKQPERRKSLPEFPCIEEHNITNIHKHEFDKKIRKPRFSIITIPKFLQKNGHSAKNLDTLLSLIGSFGMYQKFEFFLIGFLAILPSMVAYSYVFVSATPYFACKTVREVNQISLNIQSLGNGAIFTSDKNEYINMNSIENIIENRRLITIITDEQIRQHETNGSKIKFNNECKLDHSHISHLFKNNKGKQSTSWSSQDFGSFFDINGNQIRTNLTAKLHSSTLTCVEWYFDTTMYGRTLVSDWNLVCVRSHIKAATQNTFIIGTGMSVFTGIASDKFGRRNVMIILIFVMFLVLNSTQMLMHSEALSINTKILLFTISRFFQGVSSSMFTISFVLLLEITGPKHRVTAGNITAYSFSIGQMIIVGLAYYFKDWRKVQWVLALYILPFFIYYWLVPESPRWLLSVGKVDEARRVLVKITRVNRYFTMRWFNIKQTFSFKHKHKSLVDLESSVSKAYMFTLLQEEAKKLDHMKKNHNYTNTLRGILKSPMLIRRCLIIFYTWMILLAVYLGIGMGISGNMHEIMNPYLVFFIAACCEFVSIVTCHLVLNRYGRKYPLIIFMFMSSIAIYLIPVYFRTLPEVSIVFYFLAKYAIGAAQATFLIYTSELYPTPMRSTGVGMSVAIARVGGVWAPQLNVIESTIGNFNTPFMIFSFLCLLSSFFCLFLPETLNKSLPETTLQATLLNRSKK